MKPKSKAEEKGEGEEEGKEEGEGGEGLGLGPDKKGRKGGGEDGSASMATDYLNNPEEIRERWQGINTQSLGHLWFDMLK